MRRTVVLAGLRGKATAILDPRLEPLAVFGGKGGVGRAVISNVGLREARVIGEAPHGGLRVRSWTSELASILSWSRLEFTLATNDAKPFD